MDSNFRGRKRSKEFLMLQTSLLTPLKGHRGARLLSQTGSSADMEPCALSPPDTHINAVPSISIQLAVSLPRALAHPLQGQPRSPMPSSMLALTFRGSFVTISVSIWSRGHLLPWSPHSGHSSPGISLPGTQSLNEHTQTCLLFSVFC